jgi:hypothetical protein
MRINDSINRNIPQETFYNRPGGTLPTAHWNYRTVDDNPFNDASLQNIPALMSNRTSSYGPILDLNLRHTLYDGVPQIDLPLGAIDPRQDPGMNGFFDVAINAQTDNWPQYSHGAAFYGGDKDRDGTVTYDTSMPVMWKWYQDVFAGKGDQNSQAAIKIGNT